MVQLPVAHCELNPIEMPWSRVKEYVRRDNQKLTLAVVENQHEGFSCITPELWKSLVSHVEKKIEHHCWERDGLFHTKRREFIIHLGDSSDDSSSSSDDSSSEADCYVTLICCFSFHQLL